MENQIEKEILLLTNECFFELHDRIIVHFKKKYRIDKINDSQLYGFGSYDENQPNLKNEFESFSKSYINGKYLYNKAREAALGKPMLKLSGDYKLVFFTYLGFQGIHDFLNTDFLKKKQRDLQLSLLGQKNAKKDYYYLSHYYGEDRKMNLGIVIFYNDWHTCEMKYVYEEENGEKEEFVFHANITHSEPFVFIDTKYYLRNKKTEGARCVFFIGKSAPSERYFLKGVYSGFDKYDRAIAGVMILQKYDTLEEVELAMDERAFNVIISQELKSKRFIVDSRIVKDMRRISEVSPFANLIKKIVGSFSFNFKVGSDSHILNIKIIGEHYAIRSLEDSVMIEEDEIQICNNGQILKLNFKIVGLFQLQSACIHIYIFDFESDSNNITAKYLGVDINNHIISDEVKIQKLNRNK